MDATHLITPSDTHLTIKRTHMFIIGNLIVILLSLFGTIGWLFYAKHNNQYPYKKYNRTTGPPKTHKMSTFKLPNQGSS